MGNSSEWEAPAHYHLRVKVSDVREDGTAIVECRHIIDALGLDFYRGNAFKYLFRADRKGQETDINKCITNLRFWLERKESERNSTVEIPEEEWKAFINAKDGAIAMVSKGTLGKLASMPREVVSEFVEVDDEDTAF